MKISSKHLFGCILPGLAFLCSGCGHNALSYFNGAELSVEPCLENGMAAHLRYGQSLQIVMKEKSKVLLTLNQNHSTATGLQNGNQLEITFETGDQTTGYVVELEKIRRKPETSDSRKAIEPVRNSDPKPQ